MENDLLQYYERELTFIREMGAEFAVKYPKIAGRLQLEADKCEDPHVERLIESFAFIAGRIHKKIDDDFPAISESLLNVLYPHYVNPIPSMAVVQFNPIKLNVPAEGYRLDKDLRLYSQPVDGFPCQFTTTQPITLWPVQVTAAGLQDPLKPVKNARQVISIRLEPFEKIKISEIAWKNLRFFLNGPPQQIYHLYELLCNHACHLELTSTDEKGFVEQLSLKPSDLIPLGFDPAENMLFYSPRSFPGYLLLFEYFCYPEKFLFIDLHGLDRLSKLNFTDSLEIRIYLDRLPKKDLIVNAETFCLNAAPAINLFKHPAEPIRVEQQKTEYRVVPDLRRQKATEVFSVDRVTAVPTADPTAVFEYRPFYSLDHHHDANEADARRVFWMSRRTPSLKKDDKATEVYLSFADPGLKAAQPGVDSLLVHTTCTNRDLPSRLPFGHPSGDFDLESPAPVESIASLIKPTPSRRPFLAGALHWRLISHLSLNYLSIVQGGENALKEILKLYDFDDSAATRRQIDGIAKLESRYVTKKIGQSFGRGVEITITFDEDKFIGSGYYLLACVLERFLGQYVSVNSFSQLVVKTLQKKEIVKRWPPRNGERILI
ncbi:MAG: type VI secretion system baseplate subunit TssF [Desulfobacteraceae bacterium]|nr:MAG: type VI secretion system baseplate subunit TssF [Desulfobacteraceae bacterium]